MYHPVKEANMRDLAAYDRQLWKKPALRFLFFELTDQCNLHCRHCGSSCGQNNGTFLPVETVEKVMRSVAARYRPRNIMVCLTGGEPMLHPEVFRVIRTARDLGFSCGMTSNGTKITPEAARCLAVAGLDTIAVSLDGLGEVHDAFRGSPGCFDQALAGIRALKEAGIEPQVLTVVHPGNLRQLDEMYPFLLDLDIYSWRIVNVDPIGRAAKGDDILLNGEQMKQLLEYIRSRRFDRSNPMEVTYGCSHFVTYEYEREVRDFYFQCGAGTLVASVMANGDIGACLDIERRPDLVQGNAFTDDFVEVWENRFSEFRRDRTQKSSTCGACEHREVCMGDSAHTWDFDRNEPNYCLVQRWREA